MVCNKIMQVQMYLRVLGTQMSSLMKEQEIVATCQAMQELGFGFTRAMVAEVATDYLVSTSRPNHGGVPGKDWSLFLKRWPQLCVRKPEHLSKKRAEGVTQKFGDHWVELVQKVFKKNGLDELSEDEVASRLWNADETSHCLDATSTKVLARRGAKSVYEIGGGSVREYITVLGCGSANGIKLPPFVYTRLRICGRCGQGVRLLLLNMVCQTVVGWRQKISTAGSSVFLCCRCPVSLRPVQLCFLWVVVAIWYPRKYGTPIPNFLGNMEPP